MTQRRSVYPRRLADDYPTPSWPCQVVTPYLPPRIDRSWDPAEGEGAMVRAFNAAGVLMIGTGGDFLAQTRPPDPRINAIITNPPYGPSGKLARQFIEYALTLVPIVAMLLRVDFDCGRTRPHLFRYCPAFDCKLTLLDRIEWFPGEYGSSTNSAWFIWDREHRGPPTIAYASKRDVACWRPGRPRRGAGDGSSTRARPTPTSGYFANRRGREEKQPMATVVSLPHRDSATDLREWLEAAARAFAEAELKHWHASGNPFGTQDSPLSHAAGPCLHAACPSMDGGVFG